METPNQNNPANPQKPNNNQGGGNRNHRHRGHRGGKHHTGAKKEETAARQAASPVAEGNTSNAPKANQSAPQSQNKHNPQKNHHGDRKNRDNHSGKDRKPHGYFRQPPQKDAQKQQENDISLAEWRAKIVLNAADEKPADIAEQPAAPAFEEIPAAIVEEASPVAQDRPADSDLLTPAPEVPTPVVAEEEKIEVIGVRFRTSGKMYYFDPCGKQVEKGCFAIVETARGPEFGEICLENCYINKKDAVLPLRPILRIATPEDILHNEENREKEEKALSVCREKIAAHKLEMKLIEAQYAFDNSKLLFYFSAEGRVDFRELVKDLASVFHTRIELRQIGIRDEARMLGGLGVCGRMLCCSTFLPDFAQVSIKMAKEQNLSLNSAKISGVCGRLMCCLHYESEVYAAEIKLTPSNDSIVKTEDGIGTVIGSNPLAGTVRVILKDAPDQPPKQYHRDNVTVIGKEKRNAPQKATEKGE